jgi:hypothetical protein
LAHGNRLLPRQLILCRQLSTLQSNALMQWLAAVRTPQLSKLQ